MDKEQFKPGDAVRTTVARPAHGVVVKVGRKYVHVNWGTWVQPCWPEWLVKEEVK